MLNNKSDNAKIKPQNSKRREKRPPKKITETYLHNAGLYYLERFSASKNHFKTVMARKAKRSCLYHTDQSYEDCLKIVELTADKFERAGLLNDALYTSGHVASLRRRGYSRNAILNRMRIKGIATEDTAHVLNELDQTHHNDTRQAEQQAAFKLAKKKKIGPFFIGSEQNIKKSLGILARAGFSYDVARSVLEMSSDDDSFYID